MNLGSHIKSRRKNIGYTQAELAKLVGVFRHQIIRWESNQAEPSFSNFIKLCEVLGMKLEWFIHERSENNDNQ